MRENEISRRVKVDSRRSASPVAPAIGLRPAIATAGAGVALATAFGAPGAAEAHTFEVDSTADIFPFDGCAVTECTLREAFQGARDSNDTGHVDQITFTSGLSGTITLTQGELPFVDEPLNVVGPGPGALTVSGDKASRIVRIEDVGGDADTSVTISGLTLTEGEADFGGAIYSRDADLTLREVVITRNEAIHGGGLENFYGITTIERSTISNNLAGGSGGGVSVTGDFGAGLDLTIEGSTISGNRAESAVDDAVGGGVSVGGTTTIESSTISGNRSVGATGARGGGVFATSLEPATDEITVRDSTIARNEAAGPGATGGGLRAGFLYAGRTMTNTIVADNEATGSAPDLATDDPFEVTFSLVENPDGEPITTTVPGSNVFGVAPQLGALAANGGPTQTHALPAASPAADRGMATGSDQRDEPRPFDIVAVPNSAASGANGADIGAYELRTQMRCRGRPETVLGNVGTRARDVIVGTPAADRIRGRGKRDLVCAGGGRDVVIGGAGNDALRGERGRDTLKGGGGRDRLIGGPGRDRLIGGPLLDRLLGGPGRDVQSQ